MQRVIDIYNAIDQIAPFSSAMDFDNVGILVGDKNKKVKRVMVALDVTDTVVGEAKSKNCDLIISHHPIIFTPLKSLDKNDVVYKLAKFDIGVISAHTNLDICPTHGTNIALAKILELKKVRGELEYATGYIMYSGELSRIMSGQGFVKHVKKSLNASGVRAFVGDKEIKRVFFCSGSAGDYIETAVSMGADAYVTGEMKYHEEQYAAKAGITAVAAGHYETEKIFDNTVIEYLQSKFKNVGFIKSVEETPPFKVI